MIAPLEGVEARTVYFEDLYVGQSVSSDHVITELDISQFADISGDHNPIHIDKEYGAASRFGGNIAHGIYTASLISALIGMRLPGTGSIYLSQSLNFMAPVRPGDDLVVKVTVRNLIERGRRVVLDCEARVEDEVVLAGEAIVVAPKKAKAVEVLPELEVGTA